jgi:hypothetical protein
MASAKPGIGLDLLAFWALAAGLWLPLAERLGLSWAAAWAPVVLLGVPAWWLVLAEVRARLRQRPQGPQPEDESNPQPAPCD